MDMVQQSAVFRSLAVEHPGVNVWADDENKEGGWSYFWIVSEFAPGSVRNLVYVRIHCGQFQQRVYDEAGDDLWLPAL